MVMLLEFFGLFSLESRRYINGSGTWQWTGG